MKLAWTERMKAWDSVEVPILKSDEGTGAVSARGLIERRCVAMLCRMLLDVGFILDSVFDGDERVPCRTIAEAMEAIFGVDESTVRFKKDGKHLLGAFIVLGNGFDCVSD